MDKIKKRKNTFGEIQLKKKNKNDYYLKKQEYENLIFSQVVKTKNLLNKIKILEKKISRIEKFNFDLRNKNTLLEKNIMELENNKICVSMNNINFNNPYSYIN